jgi:hypothetical protein
MYTYATCHVVTVSHSHVNYTQFSSMGRYCTCTCMYSTHMHMHASMTWIGLGSTLSDSRAKKFEMELSRCPTPVIETLNLHERSFLLSPTFHRTETYDIHENTSHEPSPSSQNYPFEDQLDRSHSSQPFKHHGIRNAHNKDDCLTSRRD